ncbi:MAG TPA: tRNA uridine-5-carboxymethylaminomethyl(34) synthesis GTPase MnmE [Tepidisphaeraceae bacterium]|jgi:tRNA modification GTPase|nr:tRNA uridine-5-carboxymethylaminomethyl(34) synthesis GTPase MnmE [Tepidisphaeraceae bacterium]
MISSDTITAISTSVGPAARMILRLSGPDSYKIAAALTKPGAEGEAVRATVHFRDLHFSTWLYCFRAPHSYTAEDLIEFHIPGNPLLARMLLDELLRLGARSAEPGEFTARAFFNGRLDLTAAEGVAATIGAHNQQELSAARQLLSGELARRLQPLMDRLAQMLALLEVGIDFSEEDVSFISAEQVSTDVEDIKRQLQTLYNDSPRFDRLTHEPSFVLVGRPNAGKSTLLNALAGRSRAVVSPAAGTTRDALSAEIALDRGIVRMIDVAGLEENPPTENIPRQMHERALRTLREADFVILLRDISDQRPLLELPRHPDLLVHTKLDLIPKAAGHDGLAISAQRGQNLDLLRRQMSAFAFGSPTSVPASLALNSRHVQALDDAITSLTRAQDALKTCGDEVIALELREALHSLGQILGQLTPDDLLGRIFATFCIGK